MRFLTRNLLGFFGTECEFDMDHQLEGPYARIQTAGKPVLPPGDCLVIWWDNELHPDGMMYKRLLSLPSGQTKRSVANVIVERIAQLQVLGKPRVIRSHLYR